MRSLKLVLLAAFTFVFLGLAPTPSTTGNAQISIGLNFGAEPSCPYGYYGYAPYNCAPYGYYGPEWFNGGRFVGAGHWYHGPANFHGQVNNRYDPQHGYHGAMPARGSHAAPPAHAQAFRGNETHDNQGHVVAHGGNNGGHDNNHGHDNNGGH
jgi:hypothetical protein